MRPSALTAALKGMLALLVGHTCFDDCANVMVMARLAKASAGNRRIGSLLEMRERHSIRVRLKADTTEACGPFLVVSGFSRIRRFFGGVRLQPDPTPFCGVRLQADPALSGGVRL